MEDKIKISIKATTNIEYLEQIWYAKILLYIEIKLQSIVDWITKKRERYIKFRISK